MTRQLMAALASLALLLAIVVLAVVGGDTATEVQVWLRPMFALTLAACIGETVAGHVQRRRSRQRPAVAPDEPPETPTSH